jgi:hypothetical protein
VLARRALVLAMLVLLASGRALAGRSLGGYLDDKLMERGVTRRLASEGPGAKGVEVDTFGRDRDLARERAGRRRAALIPAGLRLYCGRCVWCSSPPCSWAP